MNRFLARLSWLLLALAHAAPAPAADALGLLVSAQQAQTTRSFEGVVVFMHDGRFDAVRVVHRPGGSGYEQLATLSGMPRALFRDAREVRIESPGREQRLAPTGFAAPAFDAARVAASYRLDDVAEERIAGFSARIVDAVARDAVRHSQRLWINPDNGLLMGFALVGPRRETLQQVMFTSLVVDPRQDAAAPVVAAPAVIDDLALAWPQGFRLVAVREQDGRRNLMLSDGLAMITLYLEQRADAIDRLTTLRRGATQLASRQIGRRRVVVIGEVPLETAVDLANRTAQALND